MKAEEEDYVYEESDDEDYADDDGEDYADDVDGEDDDGDIRNRYYKNYNNYNFRNLDCILHKLLDLYHLCTYIQNSHPHQNRIHEKKHPYQNHIHEKKHPYQKKSQYLHHLKKNI